MSNKPLRSVVLVGNIPQELKNKNQWVLWRYAWRENGEKSKWTKEPYQPSGALAKSNTKSTWSSFLSVLKVYESTDSYDGIGFVLTKQDNLVGLDFDKKLDPFTNEIEEFTSDWIDFLDSYTEVTPSGTGLRIFLHGTLDGLIGRKHTKKEIEVYEDGRFLTITGQVLGKPKTIRENCQDVLEAFHAAVWDEVKPEIVKPAVKPLDHSEDEILASIRRSKNALKFDRLFHGDDSGHNDDTSAADLAFCNYLRFHGAGPFQIDAIFRKSSRMRNKWDQKHFSDGRTYGEACIEKAMQGEVKSSPRTGKITLRQSQGIIDDGFLDKVKSKIKELPKGTGDALEQALSNGLWSDIAKLNKSEQAIASLALKTHCGIGKTDAKSFIAEAQAAEQLGPSELRDIVLESWTTKGFRAKYIAEWQEWYFYDQGVYKQVLEEMVQKLVNEILEANEQFVLEYILKDVIAKLARSEGIFQERAPESHDILNLQNGLLDLETMKLSEHSPDVLSFAQAPNAYDPNATCPKFFTFIERVLPDVKNRRTLQEFAGYVLTSKTFLQKALYLKGPGGTGKGTLASVFKALLTGEPGHGLAVDMNIEDLNDGSASLVTAINKRMIYISEVPAKANLIGFKKVVGEDRVNVNPKYKRPFDIKLEAKLIITANTWIHTGDDNANNSIDRRLIILPFEVLPREEDYNPNIVAELTTPDELAGILNWALEGWKRLKANGYRFSSLGDESKRLEFLENSNPVITFLRERCAPDMSEQIKSSELYQYWKQWCEGYEITIQEQSFYGTKERFKKVGGSGHFSGSNKSFTEKCEDALRILGWKVERTRLIPGVFWVGLKYQKLEDV